MWKEKYTKRKKRKRKEGKMEGEGGKKEGRKEGREGDKKEGRKEEQNEDSGNKNPDFIGRAFVHIMKAVFYYNAFLGGLRLFLEKRKRKFFSFSLLPIPFSPMATTAHHQTTQSICYFYNHVLYSLS